MQCMHPHEDVNGLANRVALRPRRLVARLVYYVCTPLISFSAKDLGMVPGHLLGKESVGQVNDVKARNKVQYLLIPILIDPGANLEQIIVKCSYV